MSQTTDAVVTTEMSKTDITETPLIIEITPTNTIEQSRTHTHTPTITPTLTETPIPILEGLSISVPDPRVTNPELFDLTKSIAPIYQLSKAMKLIGIEIDKEQSNNEISYRELININGELIIVGSYNLDPYVENTEEFMEGEIPLLIGKQNNEGEWQWQEATIGDMGTQLGLLIGSNYRTSEFAQSKLALKDFNTVVINEGLKYRVIHPGKDRFNYSKADKEINDVISNGKPVYFQKLLWGRKDGQRVKWLENEIKEGITREDLIEIMENHIKDIATHFQGKVYIYDLSNEPRPDGQDVYYSLIGEEYLEIAARALREADPNTKILINFPNNFNQNPKYGDPNPYWSSKVMIDLYEKGLVDAVGIQAHIFGANPPTEAQIKNVVDSFKGIPVVITEFDVNMKNVSSDEPTRLLKHAEIVANTMNYYINLDIRQIYFWEMGDSSSWLEEEPHEGRRSPEADATLYTNSLDRKPGWYSAIQVLLEQLFNNQ